MKKGFRYERIYLFTLVLAVILFFFGLFGQNIIRYQFTVLVASVLIITLNMFVWAQDRVLTQKIKRAGKDKIWRKYLWKTRARWCVSVNFILFVILILVVTRFLI